MQVRENLSVEGRHTSFSSRRGYTLSYTTILLLLACFICTLITVSVLVYNFAACPTNSLLSDDGDIVCSHRKSPKQNRNKSTDDINLTGESTSDQDVRLPRSIRPLKYNISLIPNLSIDEFKFEGSVQIRVVVDEDCSNITLHVLDLHIAKEDVSVLRVNDEGNVGEKLHIHKQYFVDSKEFFVIEFEEKLPMNTSYEIRIKFYGELLDYLQGFYRSSYEVGNETRWLASTQFQPIDARGAFPCFDEPALKARFTLNIARPSNMSSISNMPKKSTNSAVIGNLTDYVWDHFEESVPMSTYLVAFTVSDFVNLTTGSFSVWTRTDAIQSAQYALIVGPKILKFLEEYFNIPYPLPKIDMVAVPDLQFGSMENWGLITFRERIMLFEEGISPPINKQRVARAIGHELSHQWFGNLVTPKWWTDIWLNEGFASYMEYLTVDAVHPEWRMIDQFVVSELQTVFHLDALSSSHKISIEVANPDDIDEIFDKISYAKGATIIRMMSHFLTSTVFRSGLTKYLKKMEYKAAEQDDLWRLLTNEARINDVLHNSTTIKDIMDTWTLQKGFPVLFVKRLPDSFILQLEQKKFSYNNHINKGNISNSSSLWWIPVTYTTSTVLDFNTTKPLTWLPKTDKVELNNTMLYNAEWFIFNIQQTGYYRVSYETDNWVAITKHLLNPRRFKDIAPSNRAQLIDDAMNLAKGGVISYDIALNLSTYLVHEDDYVPWKAAIVAFNFIDSMFIQQGDYQLLRNYLLELIDSVYNLVGFADNVKKNDMLKLLHQSEILRVACDLGHSGCIADSHRHFQNWLHDPNPDVNNPISPNLRSIVYCTAIRYGSEAEWNFAFERYLNSKVSSEQEVLLSALACSREPWILTRYLRRSVVGEGIRKKDIYRVFASVSANVVGQQIAFDYLRLHREQIFTYLEKSVSHFNFIVKRTTRFMNTKFLLADLKRFAADDLKENGRTLQQCIEQIENNVDWMNHNYNTIVEWLKQQRVNQS